MSLLNEKQIYLGIGIIIGFFAILPGFYMGQQRCAQNCDRAINSVLDNLNWKQSHGAYLPFSIDELNISLQEELEKLNWTEVK